MAKYPQPAQTEHHKHVGTHSPIPLTAIGCSITLFVGRGGSVVLDLAIRQWRCSAKSLTYFTLAQLKPISRSFDHQF